MYRLYKKKEKDRSGGEGGLGGGCFNSVRLSELSVGVH